MTVTEPAGDAESAQVRPTVVPEAAKAAAMHSNGHADAVETTDDGDSPVTEQSSQGDTTPEAPTQKPRTRRLVKTQKKDDGLVQLVREQAEELKALREQLDTAETERDEVQDQYDDLLDKVTHIKGTLGERLKADAAKLEVCRSELEEARGELAAAQTGQAAAQAAAEKATEQVKAVKRDFEKRLEDLQSAKTAEAAKHKQEHKQLRQECERLQLSLKSLTADSDRVAKEKMGLEMALGDEKTQKSTFESKIAQITEELTTQTGYAEHYRDESLKIERELAKVTAQSNDKIEQLEQQIQTLNLEKSRLHEHLAEQSSALASKETELGQTKQQLLENGDLQSQIKEKNLQIGKLRHEAVILNEHLTNALATVRRDSKGQTIDRELISNLVIQFASIPRGDSKKFEVLQLISNTLHWDEQQQALAGLARNPGQAGDGATGGFFGKFAEFLERESNKNRGG